MSRDAVKLKQIDALGQKIIGALEKISQVLRFMTWKKAAWLRITPIQLQILTYLLNSDPRRAKVGVLASEFNISKASISDTVSLLEDKKLVDKCYRDEGGRYFTICLTNEGIQMAREAEQLDSALSKAIAGIVPAGREELFSRLSEILLDLQRSAILPVQRMCQTCIHYSSIDNTHYCGLLGQFMEVSALQLDCMDHHLSAQLWTV